MFNVNHAYKLMHAVLTAAVVAGIFTAFTGANDNFISSAVATPTQSAAIATKSCEGTWPYLNCTGNGERQVRVIR